MIGVIHVQSIKIQLSLLMAGLAIVLTGCTIDHTLKWQQGEGYRFARLSYEQGGASRFSLLDSSDTGIVFQNQLQSDQLVENHVLSSGSGVAIGDIDNDGLNDIYFSRLDGKNSLYKNLGNWRFVDVTTKAKVGCENQFSTGCSFADIDGDGDLDLLVTSLGEGTSCFINDGTGLFSDETQLRGLNSRTGATTMTLADIDGDTDLDLYVTNYKATRADNIYEPFERTFDKIVAGGTDGTPYRIHEKFKAHYKLVRNGSILLWEELGEPDVLYLNDGTGHFKTAIPDSIFADENGKQVGTLFDWGLTAKFQDLNNDSYPDLYVCNDFNSPDRIWINTGKGNFKALPRTAIGHTSQSSMAVDFSDIERDGDIDFYVVDMLGMSYARRSMQYNTMPPQGESNTPLVERPQYMRNTMFVNRGDNTFSESGRLSGVHASDWSWSTAFLDVDLDGFEDILIATGHMHDTQNLDVRERIVQRGRMGRIASPKSILKYPRLDLPNIAFRNNGDMTFSPTGKDWGFSKEEDISHGMSFGDLDNDGDMDVVVNRFEAPAALYRNNAGEKRIMVRLQSRSLNSQGVGAKISVLGGPVLQTKEVSAGGGYLSGSAPSYSFSAGNAEQLTIRVKWRDGRLTVIERALPDHIYEISDSTAAGSTDTSVINSDATLFEDVSELVEFKHKDNFASESNLQMNLPARLDQLGPGMAAMDVDRDGDVDILIAAGNSGTFGFMENNGDGTFRSRDGLVPATDREMDQTAVAGYPVGDAMFHLFIGHSNFESGKKQSFVTQHVFSKGALVKKRLINIGETSISSLALADFDGDDDLDLFVAGRSIPGRFPMPASSFLFKNREGVFEPDKKNASVFSDFGMISNALFSDIDNDGDQDIVAAVQYGPISVFRNTDGIFSNITDSLGLHKYHGLWNGVATVDLDNDGWLDIVASNWGSNGRYTPTFEHPVRAYAADFDFDSSIDFLETVYDKDLGDYVLLHSYDALINAIPFVRMRVQNAGKYSRSTAAQVIGKRLLQAFQLKVNTTEHAVFLNKKTSFLRESLPLVSQLSPAFAVIAADMNGDGNEDVFMSHNFHGGPYQAGMDDGGRGLLLTGKGTGRFEPISGVSSGIKVYGEQRGSALLDYNRDNRPDLLVAKNNGDVHLFTNKRATPGLRIILDWKAANPHAIGAKLRLRFGEKLGPVREIKAGSGYWSQDESVVIMPQPEPASGIWVCWPDGQIVETKLPVAASEIRIDKDGKIYTVDE